MKVIITGGAGFIGSCLIWKLNSQGIDDIILVDQGTALAESGNLKGKKFSDYIEKDKLLELAKANKLKVGLALNLFSPLEELEYQLLDRLDMVQLMGVEMGFQGQLFHPCAYEKIKSLKLLRQQRQLSFEIVIDGGIKADNISLIQQSGADAVVVGSWLWNNDQPQQMVESVTEL